MAWQTPKTNWGQPGQTVPTAADFNRIEGNTEYLKEQVDNKVDKVPGKGLSTNDYTDTEKNKLAGIEAGAQKNPTDYVPDSRTIAGLNLQSDISKTALQNALDFGNKLDKRTTSGLYVYTHDGSTQGEISIGAGANQIPRRDNNGHLYVPETPSDKNHAASRGYVDSRTSSGISGDFGGAYAEKTTLNDNDLLVIQDSEDVGMPKANKKVKVSALKGIKVNNATNADSLTQTLPISKGGIGTTSLTASRLVMVNSTGTALTTISASGSQVVLGDGSGRSITTSVTSGSSSLVTSGAVYNAIQNFYGSGSLTVSPPLSASTNIIKRQGNLVLINYFWETSTAPTDTTYTISIPQYASSGNTSLALRPTSSAIMWFRRKRVYYGHPLAWDDWERQTISAGGSTLFTFTNSNLPSVDRHMGIEIFMAYERT